MKQPAGRIIINTKRGDNTAPRKVDKLSLNTCDLPSANVRKATDYRIYGTLSGKIVYVNGYREAEKKLIKIKF